MPKIYDTAGSAENPVITMSSLKEYESSIDSRFEAIQNELGSGTGDATLENQETIISKLDSDIKPKLDQIIEQGVAQGSISFVILIRCSEGYNSKSFTAKSKIDNTEYTGQPEEGVCVLRVPNPGDYTITNTLNDETAEVNFTDTFIQETSFTEYHATINVTIPEMLIGETIQATDEKSHTVEAKAESTSVTLQVSYKGKWDISVKGNSYITKQSVTVTEEGDTQQATLTISSSGVPYIKVTLAEEFLNETVTCKKDLIDLKKKNTTGEVSFLVPETGEYTIGLESSEHIQESVNVNSAKEFAITLDASDTTVPILTVTSKAEDEGKTIKVSKDAHNFEKVLENRKATFILPETGEWTVTCSDYPEITKKVNCTENKIYKCAFRANVFGVKITESESDPERRVIYTDDAEGMEPVKVTTSNGNVDYKDWKDTWIFEKIYPAMVKTNGTIDYKLNPDDYSKKEEGGNSEVASTSYDGNAFVVVEKFYTKFGMDGDNETIQISDEEQDGFEAIGFIRQDGSEADRIFLPMFMGSYDSNSKLRSISGQDVKYSVSFTDFRTAAQKNGSTYDIESWATAQIMQAIYLVLMKNTNPWTALGKGRQYSGIKTGVLNNKGAIACDPTSGCVKFMHQEDFLAALSSGWYRWETGILATDGKLYIKMKPPYSGTSTSGYDQVSDFVSTESSNKYISKMKCSNKYGRYPVAYTGSNSTYEASYWYDYKNSQISVSQRGYLYGVAGRNFYGDASYSYDYFGAALSLVPPA